MQAAILAGGLGTRLKPLTERMPKAMVPVNGKPFLLHLLELLKSQGIDDIVICIGYLGGQVKAFFRNGDKLGLKIRYSEEKDKLLGTGGALKQTEGLLGDYFFVINGDTYLPISYGEIAEAFLKHNKKALMVVYDNREDTDVRNNIALDRASIVIGYNKEGPDARLEYVDAGVLLLKHEALNIMESGRAVSLEKGLCPALIRQREMMAFITRQRFFDIGTAERRRVFEEYLRRESL